MNNKAYGILIGICVGLCIAVIYAMHSTADKINANIANNTERVLQYQVVVHDTVKVKEIVRDTVTKYIKSTVYSNAIPSRLDTFEVHKGTTTISIEFADGNFDLDEVSEYQLLCNGSMYEVKDEEGSEWTNCNGEWILKMKGKRNSELDVL